MGDEAEGEEEASAPAAPTIPADVLVEKIRSDTGLAVAKLIPQADVAGLSEGGESPLVAAAMMGRADIVGKLLAAGAPADAQTSTGLSALGAAAMAGHLNCINKLLDKGATVDLQGGREQCTALILGARNGYRAVCERLLEAGSDVTLSSAYGETPESAAYEYEKGARLYACDYKTWEDEIKKRADAINAEPPPPPPLFPKDPMADLERWYRSSDPTKMLWRPGGWVHMKRPACGPVVVQERPRPFDSTGYEVQAPRIPMENSCYPAERYGMADTLAELQGGTPEALTMASRIALERTTRNPQKFNDDVKPTEAALRATVVLADSHFQRLKEQEDKLLNAFPDLPLRVGNAPTYSSGMQRASMNTPSAAATLYPMLEPPPVEALSRLLSVEGAKKFVEAYEAKKAAEAAEAEPEEA